MESLIYFLLFAGLIFLMMRFGCGAHVMGHGHGHSSSESRGSGSQARLVRPAQDIDPVCGMTVDTADAKSSVFDGRIHYFCSTVCRDRFEANPAAFVRPAETAQPKEHAHGTHH